MHPQTTTPQPAKASVALLVRQLRAPDGSCGTGCGRQPESPEHAVCQACSARLQDARTERLAHERRGELIAAVRAAPVFGELPAIPPEHARVDGAGYVQSAPAIFQTFARRWRPKSGPVLLSGAPGTHKTSSTVAALWGAADAEVERLGALGAADLYLEGGGHWLARAMWCSAFDLARARQLHGFGSEAPLVARAKKASVLVVDELGPQAANDRAQVILEIVDARYRAGLPTIGTTGMAPDEFKAAHGGGLWRRFAESGVGRVLLASEGRALVRAV